jgi:hypothetical protein
MNRAEFTGIAINDIETGNNIYGKPLKKMHLYP